MLTRLEVENCVALDNLGVADLPVRSGWLRGLFAGLIAVTFTIFACVGDAVGDVAADRRFIQQLINEFQFEKSDFSSAFLSQVSTTQLNQIVTDLAKSVGEITAVTGEGGRYRATTLTHEIDVRLERDSENRIALLFFKPPRRLDNSLVKIIEEFKALPGNVVLLVARDGKSVAKINVETAQGIGSGFKIGVLLALQDMIDAGRASWQQVVELQEHDRSLPSGQMQDWSVGSPVTLHTAATLMISNSDNTATDLLMRFIGETKMSEVLDLDIVLTTRSFFILKANHVEADIWRNGNLENRRRQMEELTTLPLPPVTKVLRPFDPAIEWLVSPKQLCAMMGRLGDHPIMAINPGLATKSSWDYVGYKGGSSPGVLSYAHHLVSGDKTYCVSVSWNGDDNVDLKRFTELNSELLFQLRKELP